jgi:hypothetical protein
MSTVRPITKTYRLNIRISIQRRPTDPNLSSPVPWLAVHIVRTRFHLNGTPFMQGFWVLWFVRSLFSEFRDAAWYRITLNVNYDVFQCPFIGPAEIAKSQSTAQTKSPGQQDVRRIVFMSLVTMCFVLNIAWPFLNAMTTDTDRIVTRPARTVESK